MRPQPAPTLAQWSSIKKLAFCFIFIFFLLYIFLNPNDVIPYANCVHKFYNRPWGNFITWFGRDVFHLINPAYKFYNSTVDTVFGYLTVLFIFSAGIFGAVVWVVVDRRRRNYYQLYQILLVVLRYYLAVSFVAYGFIKVIPIQFPPLSTVALMQTYGNSLPRELAAAFMGYARGYNCFIGSIEVIVGLLLFFRPTATFGSVLALGILINVLAFNYSFDENVKLLSTVLLLMTLFLLSKDIIRLSSFFFSDNIIYPQANPGICFNERWKKSTLLAGKYLFIIYVVFFDLKGDIATANGRGFGTQKTPLYGVYDVTLFIRNKDTIQPVITDTSRWNKLAISAPTGNAGIMLMNGEVRDFVVKPDAAKKVIELSAKKGAMNKYVFYYSISKDSILMLHGKWHNDSLKIVLKEFDNNQFKLINHQFKWTTEYN